MPVSATFFVLQLVVLVATLWIFVMSRQTSRARRSQQTSYVALAAVMGLLALAGALITVLTIGGTEDADYSLVLGTPALTLVFCGLIFWRATSARSGHPHRPSSN